MKTYTNNIHIHFRRLSLLLGAFMISRLFFYFLNYNSFSIGSFSELTGVIIGSLRFDIATIVAFNLPFILIGFMPGNFKTNIRFQRIFNVLFIIINAFLLFTNFTDSEYIKYTNKRTTGDILEYIAVNSEDMKALIPQFAKDFWYVILAFAALIWLLYKVYPKRFVRESINGNINWIKSISIYILILGYAFVLFRGTEVKPIRIITANRYVSPQNTPLILTTPFTLLKTLGDKDLELKDYFKQDEIEQIYSPVKQYKAEKSRDLNVVILIMESFSKEYIGLLNKGKGYTPFLDSLMKESLYFPNAFANGKKSIEALPSLFTSLPALMNASIIASGFSSNAFQSLPGILETKGYQTSFFHGGKNGTMGFDHFARTADIDLYYGKNEYGNDGDFDGNWGIFDEEFMQFFAKELNETKQPFFSSLFSLSSHHPYTIPAKHKGKFKGGELKILKTVEYADYALKKFFETASKMPWYENTIFVITADHTAQAMADVYKTDLGKFEVPLCIYHPGNPNLKACDSTIVQQIDVMPSLLDYLGYNEPFVSFGNSVFAKEEPHETVTFLGGIYQLYTNDYLLQFDGEKATALYQPKEDSLLQNNILDENEDISKQMEKRLKLIIQQYNNRMIYNKLHIKNCKQ